MNIADLPWASIVTTAGTVLVGLLTLMFGFFTSPPSLRRLGQLSEVIGQTPADSTAAADLGFVRDQIANEYRESFIMPSLLKRPGLVVLVFGVVYLAGSLAFGTFGLAPRWLVLEPFVYTVLFMTGLFYTLLGIALLLTHAVRAVIRKSRGDAYVTSEVNRRMRVISDRAARESQDTAEALAEARSGLGRSRRNHRLRTAALTAIAASAAVVFASQIKKTRSRHR